MTTNTYNGKIKPEFFSKVQEAYLMYKSNKQALDNRIIENNNWYKSRYAENENPEMPAPATPYLFNVIANKHADAMDNYPEPIVLPREMSDEESAKMLSSICVRI